MLGKSLNSRDQIEFVAISDLVPKDHLLRKVDAVLDLNFVYDSVKDRYCLNNGRPGIDPVILVKIVLIQHLFGIKSMRQTIREIDTNVAYRWYLGFGFHDKVPHFSTFGKNYARRFSDGQLFEEIFEHILEIAMSHGLIDTSALYIDSTHIKANANRNKYTKETIKKTATFYAEELREEVNDIRLSEGKKLYPPKESNEEKTSRVSKTDPDAGYYVKSEREKQFAYSMHACVDSHGFVLDQHVTPGNIHDSTQLHVSIDRLLEKGYSIQSVAVDAGYKTPANARYLLNKNITPYMPYTRPRGSKDLLKKSEYVYDEYYDVYLCPGGSELTYRRTDKDGYRLYMSDPMKCKECPLLSQCTKSQGKQKVITRHVWQSYIDTVEEIRHTEKGKTEYKKRSQTVERRFGDAKEQHGLRWTRHRGIKKVFRDTTLICACMNLKKLANWLIKEPQLTV